MNPPPRTVVQYRHNTGGRKKLVSVGRFLVGFKCDDNAESDERKLTVLNYEAAVHTLIFEIKPHDIGSLIHQLIEIVANNNILPKRELLETIIGSMPYDTITEMLNLLSKDGRAYLKEHINV